MEIVSVCIISMYFGAVQFAIMVMIVLHPASSYIYNVGVNGEFFRAKYHQQLIGLLLVFMSPITEISIFIAAKDCARARFALFLVFYFD